METSSAPQRDSQDRRRGRPGRAAARRHRLQAELAASTEDRTVQTRQIQELSLKLEARDEVVRDFHEVVQKLETQIREQQEKYDKALDEVNKENVELKREAAEYKQASEEQKQALKNEVNAYKQSAEEHRTRYLDSQQDLGHNKGVMEMLVNFHSQNEERRQAAEEQNRVLKNEAAEYKRAVEERIEALKNEAEQHKQATGEQRSRNNQLYQEMIDRRNDELQRMALEYDRQLREKDTEHKNRFEHLHQRACSELDVKNRQLTAANTKHAEDKNKDRELAIQCEAQGDTINELRENMRALSVIEEEKTLRRPGIARKPKRDL